MVWRGGLQENFWWRDGGWGGGGWCLIEGLEMLQKKEGLTRIEMGEKKQREGGVTLKESIPHLI